MQACLISLTTVVKMCNISCLILASDLRSYKWFTRNFSKTYKLEAYHHVSSYHLFLTFHEKNILESWVQIPSIKQEIVIQTIN